MMKAVMYHYVRKGSSDLGNFFHLDQEDFERQLDYLGKEYGFLSQEDFLKALAEKKPANGVLLTFDDGLKEHHDVVLPILKRKGLWGFFFVSTAPYETGKLLNVHRIHMLLGKYDPKEMLRALKENLQNLDLSYDEIASFKKGTYKSQESGEEATEFKRIVNYYLGDDVRTSVLDKLMEQYFGKESDLAAEFYLTGKEIKSLASSGMFVGSHTHTHPVMSKLNRDQQAQELGRSFSILENFGLSQPERFYCHPYGHEETYNEQTKDILNKLDVKNAFAVKPKDITAEDLDQNYLCLPRYDCNMFPHGKASKGLQRAKQSEDLLSSERRTL